MTRRLIQWAARFYPPSWRERYGEEFAATVEDMPAPGWAGVWDVWKGAMAMQVRYSPKVKWTAAIFALVGLALGWGVSLRIPDVYISASTLRATNGDPDVLDQSLRRVLSRKRLVALIERHGLYKAERARSPLEDVIEKMSKSVHVSRLAGKDTTKGDFTVGFANEDSVVARRVADDLVAALIEENLLASATQRAGLITVLAPATDLGPIYPNRRVFVFTSMLGAAVLGAGWAVLKARTA